MRNMRRLVCLAFTALLTTACASPVDIRKSEIDAFDRAADTNIPAYYALDDFGQLVRYSYSLSESYMLVSDRSTVMQDSLSAGILGAAATAAGGLLYGANLDLIRGAGIAAGVLGAGDQYLKPAETSARLLDASEALVCMVIAARKTQSPKSERNYATDAGSPYDAERIAILSDGVARVRINLRKLLTRQTPSYSGVAQALLAAAREGAGGFGTSASSAAGARAAAVDIPKELGKLNATFRADVLACSLPQ